MPTNQASQDALVEQLAAAIEGSVDRRDARGRDRHAVGDRVRHGQDPRQRQHPAARHPAAPAADRAHGRAGLRRERRRLRGAGRGVRGRPDHGPVAGDVHDRHRRRRRLGAQRPAVPRRDDVGGRGRATRSSAATWSSATACRATRSRSAARWRRWPRGVRWTGWPTTPRSSTATPTSARCAAQKGDIDGHDVVAGAEAGDEASLWCLRVLGERLGIGIANAINTFDPLEVVIGGGVSHAGELLLDPARDAAFRHVVPGLGLNTTIRDRAPRAARGRARRGADRRAGVRRGDGPEPAGSDIGGEHREDRVRVRPCGVPAEGDGARDRDRGGPRGRSTSARGRPTRSTIRTRPGWPPRPSRGDADRAVLVCGSGAGVAVAACKFPDIRAVVAHDTYTAHQSVEHDDCNILCLGGRVIGPALAADIIRAYLARRSPARTATSGGWRRSTASSASSCGTTSSREACDASSRMRRLR